MWGRAKELSKLRIVQGGQRNSSSHCCDSCERNDIDKNLSAVFPISLRPKSSVAIREAASSACPARNIATQLCQRARSLGKLPSLSCRGRQGPNIVSVVHPAQDVHELCVASLTGRTLGACLRIEPVVSTRGTSDYRGPSTGGFLLCQRLPKSRRLEPLQPAGRVVLPTVMRFLYALGVAPG
jgi:hypothetical protein